MKLEFIYMEWFMGGACFNLLADNKDTLYGIQIPKKDDDSPMKITRYGNFFRKYPANYDIVLIKYDVINIFMEDGANGGINNPKYNLQKLKDSLEGKGPIYFVK